MTYAAAFRKVNPADQPIISVSCRRRCRCRQVDDYAEITAGAADFASCRASPRSLVFGAAEIRRRVQVDPVAAARMISLEDVRTVIEKRNSNTPVGTMSGPSRPEHDRLTHRPRCSPPPNTATSMVAYRNGAPVKLNEIAQSSTASRTPLRRQLYNNERSIVLAIQRAARRNTVELVDTCGIAADACAPKFRPSVRCSRCSTARFRSATRSTTCRRRW